MLSQAPSFFDYSQCSLSSQRPERYPACLFNNVYCPCQSHRELQQVQATKLRHSMQKKAHQGGKTETET
eukprot:gene5269-3776_t